MAVPVNNKPLSQLISSICYAVGFLTLYFLAQAVLLLYLNEDLRLAVSTHLDINIFQYLPQSTIENNFWLAIYYLQQTPPIPQMVMAAMYGLGSVYAVTLALIVLEIVFMGASWLLVFCMLRRENLPPWVCLVLCSLFAANLDLFMLQFSQLGRTFYEFLCMFLVMGMLISAQGLIQWSGVQARRTPVNDDAAAQRPPYGIAMVLGLCAAGLALTRSSFSYVCLIPALLFLVEPALRKPGLIIVFLLPVLLYQGGWSLKQKAAFGEFRWETSTWGGFSVNQSVLFRDGQQRVVAYYRKHRDQQPEWFNRLMDSGGEPLQLTYPVLDDFVPMAIRKQDEEISHSLGRGNKPRNTMATALLSDTYKRLYLGFLLTDWYHTTSMISKSYRLFLLPTRNHMQGMSTSLLFVNEPNDIPISLSRMAGEPYPLQNEVHVNVSKSPGGYFNLKKPDSHRKLNMDWWGIYSTLVLQLVFLSIHLGPVALLYLALTKSITRDSFGEIKVLFFGYLLLIYLSGLSSLVEYGENMRFRASIEPLLCFMTILIFNICIKSFKAKRLGVAMGGN